MRYLALALALAACSPRPDHPPASDSLPPDTAAVIDSAALDTLDSKARGEPDSTAGLDTLPIDSARSASGLRSAIYGAAFKPARKLKLSVQGLAACPATGNCRVILSWQSPPGYTPTTDTARVEWLQTTPAAASPKPDHAQRGTADTLSITRPAAGASKSGPVNLCHVRANWAGKACNTPLTWIVTAPVAPIDTATGVKLTGIIIKPDTIKILAADWTAKNLGYDTTLKKVINLTTRAVVDCPTAGALCPQKQVCAFAKLSDGSVGMTENSSPILACRPPYDAIPGHRASYAPAQVIASASMVPVPIQIGETEIELVPRGDGFFDVNTFTPIQVAGWRRLAGIWYPPPASASPFAYYLDHQMPATVATAILASVRQ